MKIEGDDVVFSSGTRVYACFGIIGIGVEGDDLAVTYGYDGGFFNPGFDYGPSKIQRPDLLELADSMMARWAAFKKKVELATEEQLSSLSWDGD